MTTNIFDELDFRKPSNFSVLKTAESKVNIYVRPPPGGVSSKAAILLLFIHCLLLLPLCVWVVLGVCTHGGAVSRESLLLYFNCDLAVVLLLLSRPHGAVVWSVIWVSSSRCRGLVYSL